MRRAALAVLALAAACGEAAPTEPDAGADTDAEARPPAGAVRGTFDLTYYWVTAEADYPGTPSEPLYDASCHALATVTPEFARNLRLEGTGRLADGRVLNVAGACACDRSPCFVEVDGGHPWGIGVQNRPLEPYRSVAVDHNVVPYGTSLYVEELDGVPVPGDPPWGGFVHDGCVVAADTGGSIVGTHLDWFVGLRSSYRTLDAALDRTTITVHDGGARCP